MKEQYEAPIIEIIEFETEDIIMTSDHYPDEVLPLE